MGGGLLGNNVNAGPERRAPVGVGGRGDGVEFHGKGRRSAVEQVVEDAPAADLQFIVLDAAGCSGIGQREIARFHAHSRVEGLVSHNIGVEIVVQPDRVAFIVVRADVLEQVIRYHVPGRRVAVASPAHVHALVAQVLDDVVLNRDVGGIGVARDVGVGADVPDPRRIERCDALHGLCVDAGSTGEGHASGVGKSRVFPGQCEAFDRHIAGQHVDQECMRAGIGVGARHAGLDDRFGSTSAVVGWIVRGVGTQQRQRRADDGAADKCSGTDVDDGAGCRHIDAALDGARSIVLTALRDENVGCAQFNVAVTRIVEVIGDLVLNGIRRWRARQGQCAAERAVKADGRGVEHLGRGSAQSAIGQGDVVAGLIRKGQCSESLADEGRGCRKGVRYVRVVIGKRRLVIDGQTGCAAGDGPAGHGHGAAVDLDAGGVVAQGHAGNRHGGGGVGAGRILLDVDAGVEIGNRVCAGEFGRHAHLTPIERGGADISAHRASPGGVEGHCVVLEVDDTAGAAKNA